MRDELKEYIVKKNIYSVSTLLAIFGVITAGFSAMIKMYIVYKTSGYLNYFGVNPELIIFNNTFSFYSVAMLFVAAILLCVFIYGVKNLIHNTFFIIKYLKYIDAKKENICYLVGGFLISLLVGKIIILIIIPFLELDNYYGNYLQVWGPIGLLFVCIVFSVLSEIVHKNTNDKSEYKTKNTNGYISIFDYIVYTSVLIIVLSFLLIGSAQYIGIDIAKNKKEFYITNLNNKEYVIIYVNNDELLLEKCCEDGVTLKIFTEQQLIKDRNNIELEKKVFKNVLINRLKND